MMSIRAWRVFACVVAVNGAVLLVAGDIEQGSIKATLAVIVWMLADVLEQSNGGQNE